MTEPSDELKAIRRTLEFMKDDERLILARELEAKELLQPIRNRKVRNNYLGEARELLGRRLANGP